MRRAELRVRAMGRRPAAGDAEPSGSVLGRTDVAPFPGNCLCVETDGGSMRDRRESHRARRCDAPPRGADLRILDRLEQQLRDADERIVRLRRTLAGRPGPPPASPTRASARRPPT